MSDTDANITRRAEANDPLVMCQEGVQQAKKGNSRRAFEGCCWWSSECEIPSCVWYEERKGRIDRAVKHSSSRRIIIRSIAAMKTGAGMRARRKREIDGEIEQQVSG
eukprot:scaffold32715_cov160-Skeletonema_menzelii.AAC.2